MSPRTKQLFSNVIEPDEDFGIMVIKKSDIPIPKGRGRIALIPQLTVAKALDKALKSAAENGVGVSEEVCGFDLTAPGTVKEATKLKLKNVAVAFFSYIMKELEHYNLKDKITVVRREEGKQIYLQGPQV